MRSQARSGSLPGVGNSLFKVVKEVCASRAALPKPRSPEQRSLSRAAARAALQLEGTVNPDELTKKYPPGHYTCTRFDIVPSKAKEDEDEIEPYPKPLLVKQVSKTSLFDTVTDAASYLTREGGPPKDKYYGQLLLETDEAVFK